MLVVPFVVGVVHGGPAPVHLVLLVTWVVGYMAFAAAGLWLRSRRKPVYRAPLLTYGAISLLAGLGVLAVRPGLAVWAPVFAPLAAVSLWFSARRDDRALANDVVTIVAACLITPVAASAGAAMSGTTAADVLAVVRDPDLVGRTLALITYFVGTSLYVKTLIRERTSRGYRQASVGYHAAATLLWAVVPLLVTPWASVPMPAHALLVAFFAMTTARAAVLAGRRIRPMHAGLGEIGLSVLLTLILLLTW